MDNIQIQKSFFHPVCNTEEIERIFNVNNAQDYLLKIRAETIVDNMRLFRVYRNKALISGNNWSLEKSFNSSHYHNFINSLSDSEKNKCNNITYGNIFSNDPHGKIFSTKYGPIITICDSYQFFFKFMNLALMNFGDKIPSYVKLNSLRIAIRVMLKTETLDFFMDPRGIIPNNIGKVIHSTIPNQMLFIAGHEFCHYLLGHLRDVNTTDKPIYYAILPNDNDYKYMKVYNKSQSQEFEADINSIQMPNYDLNQKTGVMEGALLWLGYIDLYEAVIDTIAPKSSSTVETHPTARERYENILSKIPTLPQFDYETYKKFLKILDEYKEILINDVSYNIELYETYGSIYFDKPNTKWRGKELIDRVDYY